MQKKQKQSLAASFKHAFEGWWWALQHERNLQLHTMFTLMVLLLGLWLTPSRSEWLALVIFLVLVPACELFNTALEQLCDTVRDELELDYAATKGPRDLAAAAVLYSSAGAVITGLIVFLPKILALCF
ncbi:diacylglycerol kinase family protein [bacterium]|nr:diacylglycerol kinase family protein [bacterium]